MNNTATLNMDHNFKELFRKHVGLFANAFEQEPEENVPLGRVLEMIRDGKWENDVAALRRRLDRGDTKGYDDKKRALCAMTMSVALLTRDKDVPFEAKVLGHSGILQGDFDAKENPQLGDIADIKDRLAEDPHVAFVFTSPSGRGIKAGICIDPERHRESFFGAEQYFLDKYGLQMDRSCKDPVRMCFVSHDPDLRVNPQAVPVPVLQQAGGSSSSSDWSAPVETTAEDIREMLSFVPRRPEYSDWLRIASAVWSVLPMEEGCRILAHWSPEEREGEYAEKHRHRLAEIGIGTLVWYAKQGGFDASAAARRKCWAGRVRFADPISRDAGENFDEDPSKDIRQVELTREFVRECFDKNQRGDAALWAHLARGKKLYDHLAQMWRCYENGVWERDDMQRSFVECSDALAATYGELVKSIERDMIEAPADDPKKDPRGKQVQQLNNRIGKLHGTGHLGGVIKFAESILGTKATLFDTDHAVLVARNGVVDLRNGVFREHRPSDMATVQTICGFDPQAQCPRWDRFLDFFMDGDQEMVDYLARVVGYCLTGFVDKDVLFFHYGRGANGKSTFAAAIKMLMGGLMTTIPIEALLAKASDNNFDYQKAEMQGKRIVVSDEIPESRKLNESAIKSLVGGDDITARRPYEKPYTFSPTHKLWLIGNHKPKITGTDYGIWRRVHLVPWLRTMPEEERRPRHEVLGEFREEMAGILNWAIAGYIDMVDNGGLRPPQKVTDATKEYRQDSDQMGQFIESRLDPIPGGSALVTDVRHAYEAWCEDEGEEVKYKTNQRMISYFREAGFDVAIGQYKKKVLMNYNIKSPD